MSVYFIRATTGGPIKIGYSKNCALRLAQMQPHSPVALELVAEIEGEPSLEKRLHSYFAHLSIRHEWFEASEALLNAIAELRAGAFDYAKLPAKGTAAWAIRRRTERLAA